MKRLPVLTLIFSLVLLVAARAADAPGANPQQDQVLALLKDVQNQQSEIAANQLKIDTKIAAIAEAVRVARLYSARGGK